MKGKASLSKVVNGSGELLKEYEYNFGLIDKSNPGLYRFSI